MSLPQNIGKQYLHPPSKSHSTFKQYIPITLFASDKTHFGQSVDRWQKLE